VPIVPPSEYEDPVSERHRADARHLRAVELASSSERRQA
jgi:beta-glucosidase